MSKILKVVDYFKAPYVWQLTGQKPTVEIEDRIIYFCFPDEPKFRQAVHSYLNGEPCPNLKEFISMFKILRGEMQLMKNQVRTAENKRG